MRFLVFLDVHVLGNCLRFHVEYFSQFVEDTWHLLMINDHFPLLLVERRQNAVASGKGLQWGGYGSTAVISNKLVNSVRHPYLRAMQVLWSQTFWSKKTSRDTLCTLSIRHIDTQGTRFKRVLIATQYSWLLRHYLYVFKVVCCILLSMGKKC